VNTRNEPNWLPVRNHIIQSFGKAANICYGESAVTELEHADDAGADEELVIACMLHDVARFAAPQEQISDTLQETKISEGAMGHGEVAARMMFELLPARTLFCIRHHAEAKQYLCQTNPSYRAKLAPASIRTLEIQAAETGQKELDSLAEHEWWKDALRVRVWDDSAKQKGKPTKSFAYWTSRLDQFLTSTHSPST